MKKIVMILVTGLFLSAASYALKITSDANGPVTLSDPQLKVGEMAPKVSLVSPDFKNVEVGGMTGKVQIISTIESFNTSVCDLQTMKLNEAGKRLKNIQISVVTANMPFIMDDFRTKHKINSINLLSTFNRNIFGKKYGVQVVGGELTGITARSIFVIDKNGRIIYKEITPDIDKMPHLQRAIQIAIRADKKNNPIKK